jgi:hypothetical protein
MGADRSFACRPTNFPLLALSSLSELPLVGPLFGAKQTPLWQVEPDAFEAIAASPD